MCLVHFLLNHITMKPYSYLVEMNFILVIVYYNKEKSHLLIINVDVTLCDLNNQLDQMNNCLNYRDTRRVIDVEYYRFSIDSDEHVLTQMDMLCSLIHNSKMMMIQEPCF